MPSAKNDCTYWLVSATPVAFAPGTLAANAVTASPSVCASPTVSGGAPSYASRLPLVRVAAVFAPAKPATGPRSPIAACCEAASAATLARSRFASTTVTLRSAVTSAVSACSGRSAFAAAIAAIKASRSAGVPLGSSAAAMAVSVSPVLTR